MGFCRSLRILLCGLVPVALGIGVVLASGQVNNLKTILGKGDDPNLPPGQLDLVFFQDVFHNVIDRPGYLALLATCLKPGGQIAIVEQEFDDPIAKRWDIPEDRITEQQVAEWMSGIDFVKIDSFDIFKGQNNPAGSGMPERWFVVYGRSTESDP